MISGTKLRTICSTLKKRIREYLGNNTYELFHFYLLFRKCRSLLVHEQIGCPFVGVFNNNNLQKRLHLRVKTNFLKLPDILSTHYFLNFHFGNMLLLLLLLVVLLLLLLSASWLCMIQRTLTECTEVLG